MSYLVLARKYRPGTFESVEGQDVVTRTLKHAIDRDRVGHALLFCGPRGVGKTSVARVFSKALNCLNRKNGEPCNTCAHCTEIQLGKSFAVQEIDGASHNGVDTIRELIDHFRTPPPPGFPYKIYIIDEVHMLSTAAFNALLKSLEEPPPQTIFILATTEVHKIPDTVLSRCQRYDFRSLPVTSIEQSLQEIAKKEGMTVEPGVFRLVARLADGSMRDAQSIFDRVSLFSNEIIREEEASKLLGVSGGRSLLRLVEAVCRRETSEALSLLSQMCHQGLDLTLLIRDFAGFFRELMLIRSGGRILLKEDGLSEEEIIERERATAHLSDHDLQELERLARIGCDAALRTAFPRYAFEALLVRMSTRIPVEDIASLIDKLSTGSTSASPQKGSAQRVSATPSVSRKASDDKLPSPSGPSLDWRSFVAFTESKSSKILAEYLKRFQIKQFAGGILSATAPQFTIQTLKKSDEQLRLKKLLQDFSGTENWSIELTAADSSTGSLTEEAAEKRKTQKSSAEANLVQHPQVQALQALFPGSEIEHIDVATTYSEGDEL